MCGGFFPKWWCHSLPMIDICWFIFSVLPVWQVFDSWSLLHWHEVIQLAEYNRSQTQGQEEWVFFFDMRATWWAGHLKTQTLRQHSFFWTLVPSLCGVMRWRIEFKYVRELKGGEMTTPINLWQIYKTLSPAWFEFDRLLILKFWIYSAETSFFHSLLSTLQRCRTPDGRLQQWLW